VYLRQDLDTTAMCKVCDAAVNHHNAEIRYGVVPPTNLRQHWETLGQMKEDKPGSGAAGTALITGGGSQ